LDEDTNYEIDMSVMTESENDNINSTTTPSLTTTSKEKSSKKRGKSFLDRFDESISNIMQDDAQLL
jgi:hypothetical protein